MASLKPAEPPNCDVFVRWRPLSADEASEPELEHKTTKQSSGKDTKQIVSLKSQFRIGPPPKFGRHQTWKSGPSYSHVFQATEKNEDLYQTIVAPTLPQVLTGSTCTFFAYGHTGSGKTHTIVGYTRENEDQLGLYVAAAKDLFQVVGGLNKDVGETEDDDKDGEKLGIAIRLFELRGKCAYDLLNNGNECHIREGREGVVHVRGATELLEGGKVRVRPITAKPCWSFEEFRTTISGALALREVGSSTVHDESSRTHAIMELEIVNRALMSARDAVIERESELVPVGKRATDVYVEEHSAAFIQVGSDYMMRPDRPLNQALIDATEAEKQECENRVTAAEAKVAECFNSSRHSCLGGKFVFVDLAGSEYFHKIVASSGRVPEQSPQERQQLRQINADLFALKEVIRARLSNQARVPYRSSPLTMVLRSHFVGAHVGKSAMILTVSPSDSQFAATMNTLRYGDLVGSAGRRE